jgi:hypothetical protein
MGNNLSACSAGSGCPPTPRPPTCCSPPAKQRLLSSSHIIPFESLEHRAVIPLTPLPPALAGKVPDLPVPLGQPVRTPDGVEITVLDSTATSEPLPVGNETGSVTLLWSPEKGMSGVW